jgi:CheY-like chemotaxis protein
MPSNPKIMIVDDNIDETVNLKMILEPEGYEVVQAMNGNEAREKVQSEHPDFIVLDVMMPEMDGFSFCSWLRTRKKFKQVPILLLTAVSKHIYDSRYSKNGVIHANADEYLEKPVRPEILLETISRLIKK